MMKSDHANMLETQSVTSTRLTCVADAESQIIDEEIDASVSRLQWSRVNILGLIEGTASNASRARARPGLWAFSSFVVPRGRWLSLRPSAQRSLGMGNLTL